MRVLEKTPVTARLCLAAASTVMTANLTAKRTVRCVAARTEADIIALTTCTHGPARTRMVDQDQVRKPMLYPLSYGGREPRRGYPTRPVMRLAETNRT